MSEPAASDAGADGVSLAGHWYPPGSSGRHAARLALSPDGYRLVPRAGAAAASDAPEAPIGAGPLAELEFDEPLGATARRVRWPGGAMFETSDAAALDAWRRSHGHGTGWRHALERSWPVALLALALTGALLAGAYRHGVPFVAERVAARVPIAVSERVSRETFDVLDDFGAGDSDVDLATRKALRARFDDLVDALPADGPADGFDYRLYFRAMGDLPNAFALPGGQVVVTDAFVALVRDRPGEFDAVMLHEIGHVRLRHGLRGVLQASAVSVAVSVALGDAAGIGQLVTAAPLVLLQSGYTRDFEREADEFAFAAMRGSGRDPAAFASVLRRLQAAARGGEPGSSTSGEGAPREDGSAFDYLSTHPATAERARRALELSRTP